MLIFELQDNKIKAEMQRLDGNIMATEPWRYIYFMDYPEYQQLAIQIRKLSNNPDACVEDKLYRMIAASVVTSGMNYLFYCLFDTPYCIMLMPNNIEVETVIQATIQLAGRMLDEKRKVELKGDSITDDTEAIKGYIKTGFPIPKGELDYGLKMVVLE